MNQCYRKVYYSTLAVKGQSLFRKDEFSRQLPQWCHLIGYKLILDAFNIYILKALNPLRIIIG